MRLISPTNNDFDAIHRTFRWQIPNQFNIATAVCDRHAKNGDRIALYWEHQDGRNSQYTFLGIERLSNQFANVLKARGIKKGDRVAIVLPQRVETAIAHLAAFKLGAITVPLSVLFGADAISYRLLDSGAQAVVCATQHFDMLQELQKDLPDLKTILSCDSWGADSFWSMMEMANDSLLVCPTSSDDPAIIIYTSGTTGPPKGALVAHRCLLGNLTGFELSQEFFPQSGDLFWTPADWAWTGGLIDALLPSWYYGIPVLGYESGRFDAEKVCELVGRHKVRNAFIPPTALKMMRQVPDLRRRFNLNFRSIMSAGESMGAELYHWGVESLGIEINEMWAQSEFNYIVGNCASKMAIKPGSMGKAYPGHRVSPVNEQGEELAVGEVGELAALRDDPVMFLGYWNKDQATRDKFIGPWWGTGDVGYKDEDGYLWFVGRKDDVISSAGYRIGPAEIEDCLLKHPAVLQAAAVGSPDELRGNIVKAFIVLADGYEPRTELKTEIQEAVRNRLAAYEYPREIEFLSELPMTTTGKVRRIELRQRELEKKSNHAGL